jgi:DNA-binding response OmpR family regulator
MDQAHPTIAIVEDERILRDELAFQLTHLGFAVETFETAAQLYRRLAVCRYAVVVLDIGLADEDGLSICRYLRRHDKQLGLVFITARATRDDRLTGLQAGGDAYLTKPVDIDELALAAQTAGRACRRRTRLAGTAQSVPATQRLAAGTRWRCPARSGRGADSAQSQ